MAGSRISTRIAVLILPFKGRTEVGMGGVCEQQYSIYPIPIPGLPLEGEGEYSASHRLFEA